MSAVTRVDRVLEVRPDKVVNAVAMASIIAKISETDSRGRMEDWLSELIVGHDMCGRHRGT